MNLSNPLQSPLRKNGFTFKQFFIAHDRCAMKVGTDGILLGAWAPVAGVKSVLDIGTGSGLIALMLAQRTGPGVEIDAIELDPDAALQAKENAAASPWAERVAVYQQDISRWSGVAGKRYSLIVSNPPWYTSGPDCASPERDAARSTVRLDHRELLRCAGQLIDGEGYFCVILPESVSHAFLEQASNDGWHLRFRNDIASYEHRLPHRVLLGLSFSAGEFLCERMSIRGADHAYSACYRALTRDFYLFMSPEQ